MNPGHRLFRPSPEAGRIDQATPRPLKEWFRGFLKEGGEIG